MIKLPSLKEALQLGFGRVSEIPTKGGEKDFEEVAVIGDWESEDFSSRKVRNVIPGHPTS